MLGDYNVGRAEGERETLTAGPSAIVIIILFLYPTDSFQMDLLNLRGPEGFKVTLFTVVSISTRIDVLNLALTASLCRTTVM